MMEEISEWNECLITRATVREAWAVMGKSWQAELLQTFFFFFYKMASLVTLPLHAVGITGCTWQNIANENVQRHVITDYPVAVPF